MRLIDEEQRYYPQNHKAVTYQIANANTWEQIPDVPPHVKKFIIKARDSTIEWQISHDNGENFETVWPGYVVSKNVDVGKTGIWVRSPTAGIILECEFWW